MVAQDILHSAVEEATGELFSDKADELFEAICGDDHCFFLDSGCGGERLGRYSIIGSKPGTVLRSSGEKIKVEYQGAIESYDGDPFTKLRELLAKRRVEYAGQLPFVGGAVGYLGYGLCKFTSGIEPACADDVPMNDMELGFYDRSVVCDNLEGRVWLVSCGADEAECGKGLEEMRASFRRRPAMKSEHPPLRIVPMPQTNFTKEEYFRAVERIKEYIWAGDAYQVNLSQRFSSECKEDPWSLYRRLRRINPAPFSAYIRFGDTAVLCSSPERFLSVRGHQVETRPIKGTRPRGAREEDGRLAEELRSSAKDRAEHVMIVDLERNDLGRVCEWGSVHVSEFEAIESYPTVHHMVSTVRGRLRRDVGLVDCLRACFPGGSITGAPKVRAMEIIEELEPNRRGLYTGSLGYLGYDGSMDLNIVIRTMVLRGGRVHFSVGGGVVADSTAEGEYAETFDKARALFQSLGIIL
jgi:para-aminobenzoate synthetase component I